MNAHGIHCQLSPGSSKEIGVRRGGMKELQHNNSFNPTRESRASMMLPRGASWMLARGRVNSGVRHAARNKRAEQCVAKQSNPMLTLNGRITGRSNKRFDPTGISLAFIENLSIAQMSPGGSIAALCLRFSLTHS
jgi:hypothetical protein